MSAERPGSSWGIYCHYGAAQREGACPETLTLVRTTAIPPTHEDDYRRLSPALAEAAVSLGWRINHGVWWCPTHVVAMKFACARCASPCPECSCANGPLADAVEGMIE